MRSHVFKKEKRLKRYKHEGEREREGGQRITTRIRDHMDREHFVFDSGYDALLSFRKKIEEKNSNVLPKIVKTIVSLVIAARLLV